MFQSKKSPVTFAVLAALSSLSSQNVLAKSDTTELDPVVVTANNTPQRLSSVTANTVIIDQAEIEQKQYKTLADAIRQIPGLSTYSNGGLGTQTGLFLRGMSGKNILVLQNGMQLNDPTLTDGTTNFANILLDDVERIEIIKGPQSGVWGANASAGVINIITKKGGNQANVNFELGANNHRKLAATLGAGNERVDFTFNLTDLATDGFTAIKHYRTSGSGEEQDPFSQQEASFNLGVNLNKDQRLEAFVKHTSASNNYDYSTPNDNYTSTYDNSLKQLKYLVALNNVDTKLYAQESQSTTTYASGKVNQVGAQANWQYATKQQANFALTSKQLIDLKNGNNHYNNQSVSLNNTNQLFNDKWVITEAIRNDAFDVFKNKTTGKIGTKFSFTPNTFMSANYGTGYNAPSLYQLVHISTLTTKLIPESTSGYDISFGLSGLEVTYFNTEVKNELQYNYAGWDGYYNQVGISKYEGIEATYKRSIKAIDSDLTLNFTQQTAKDANGKWLVRRPKQQGGICLDYYGLTKTHIGVQTQYTGKFYENVYSPYPTHTLLNTVEQQGYVTTDLVADYQVNKHLTLYGKVQNLFGEDYVAAVASYEADNVTPKYVYNNGGTLWFVGVRGKL